MSSEKATVRLDKWLWAARFHKTRSLAKQAIEGGKVHYNGQRVKTSKQVEVGAELRIRCGWDEKTIKVLALSEQRKGAPEAALLYEETAESLEYRQTKAAERKAANITSADFVARPNKKQRRQIHRFKRQSESPEE